MKKHLSLIAKIVVVGALLTFLAQRGFLSLDACAKAFTHWEKMALAFSILLSTTFVSVFRWQWLLRAQGIRLRWVRVMQLTFIGNFFNLALPGAVSGDFVKAFFVAREVEGHRAKAFGSILFDRLAGLSALVLVSAVAMALQNDFLAGTPLLRGLRMFVQIAAAVVAVSYVYLFLVREEHDPLLSVLRMVEKRFPRAGSATRTYEGLRNYHNHRWVVLRVVLVSIVIHISVCTSFLLFLQAFDEPAILQSAVYVVSPLGLLVTAVPIAPAGVGTGHAAFSWLYHFLGSGRGADVFSLFVLSQLIGGIAGGLIYLRFKSSGTSMYARPERISVEFS